MVNIDIHSPMVTCMKILKSKWDLLKQTANIPCHMVFRLGAQATALLHVVFCAVLCHGNEYIAT